MELFLQMGHGMMEHAKSLLTAWGGGSCILSPRDLTAEQMEKFSHDIKSVGGMEIAICSPFSLYPLKSLNILSFPEINGVS